MAAGAYPQAIVAYRSFIHENPQDSVAQEGLGGAELATGNYREARIAFARAQRERPSDAVLARQLELVDRVMSLDPTPRQLSSREKYDRSITLLTQVTGKAKDCFTREQPSGDVTAFLAEADRLPVQQTRGTPTNEMSEALLSLAERLWRGVPQHCRDHPTGEALPIIMQKVAQ
jgi:hypothetical protein